MKSHTEHTGVEGAGRIDPSLALFLSNWLTIVAPEPPTSLEEIAHHGTWEDYSWMGGCTMDHQELPQTEGTDLEA